MRCQRCGLEAIQKTPDPKNPSQLIETQYFLVTSEDSTPLGWGCFVVRVSTKGIAYRHWGKETEWKEFRFSELEHLEATFTLDSTWIEEYIEIHKQKIAELQETLAKLKRAVLEELKAAENKRAMLLDNKPEVKPRSRRKHGAKTLQSL